MEVIRDGGTVPAALRGGALAIGNFDGVHLGHQAVIGRAVARARASGAPSLVLTFDPHPSRLFRPDAPPFLLTTLEQRLQLFAGLGVSATVVLPFTRALAAEPAEAFVAEWLARRIGPRHVVTGTDFSFGRGREGDAATLARLGEQHGFSAEAVPPVMDRGAPVSSTRVRAALQAGDPAEAARLLTRPFAIEGVVIPGDRRGRLLDAPTANMELGPYVRPRYGVYAVRVQLPCGTTAAGVANLGIRPMFEPPQLLLETWILDWSGDLYGKRLAVGLVAYLRPELRLEGLEALKAQMARDAEAARAALARAEAVPV